MILLDTCALVFDALSPEKLGKTAKRTIIAADKAGTLACSDISLWEISMLIQKKEYNPVFQKLNFLNYYCKHAVYKY